MFKNILLPTDGSELSQTAIKAGVGLAKALGANVTGFYAAPDITALVIYGEIAPYIPPLELEKMAQNEAKKYLSVVEREARAAGVEVETVWVKNNAPYAAILEAAQKRRCDLIFMASHGRRGISALLLGSETTKVLAHSKIPVLIYR